MLENITVPMVPSCNKYFGYYPYPQSSNAILDIYASQSSTNCFSPKFSPGRPSLLMFPIPKSWCNVSVSTPEMASWRRALFETFVASFVVCSALSAEGASCGGFSAAPTELFRPSLANGDLRQLSTLAC